MLVKVADIPWSKRMAKGFEPPVDSPMEVREVKILNRSVLQHFQQIKDPRVDRTKRHSLMAIITIAILAVLAGADGFVAIETYGKAKQKWLEKFLDLPDGIPSHDTNASGVGSVGAWRVANKFFELGK